MPVREDIPCLFYLELMKAEEAYVRQWFLNSAATK